MLANAANTVHVLVSHLRRSLAADREPSPLVTRRPGYFLRVGAGRVDMERAERLRDEASRAMAAGDPGAAAASLRRAIALWRDEPLPELCESVELAGERRRLADLRLDLLEERIDADLACGRHREIAAEATALVRDERLRERLRGQLMVALYRCGRQADALQVYRDGRRALVETLGVEPGPELRALERAILNHDPALRAPPPTLSRLRTRRRLVAIAAAITTVIAVPVLVALNGHGATPSADDLAEQIDAAHGVVVTTRLPGVGAVAIQPDGTAWVADTSAGTIAHVGRSGAVRIAGVGGRPSDLAWGFGEVWIGDAAHRRLLAYDPATGSTALTARLAATVGPVGQPAAHIAVGAGSVWVDNGGSAGVWRIDPTTGHVVAHIRGVQTGAITYGLGSIWVAGDFFSSPRIDRINPNTDRRAGSIPLPAGAPVAITATAGGALWVVTDDGTLWRVDPKTGATTTVPVSDIHAIASDASQVWATTSNAVLRLDPATGRQIARTPIARQPVALAASGAHVWVTAALATHAPGATATRGTITVSLNTGIDTIDPALSQWATVWQIEYATELRLLTYPDRAGAAGTQLVPDAAAAMPTVSNHGRTYTFTLRPGLRFWPGGEPVTAACFRAAVERALSPGLDSPFARDFMRDLVGAAAYEHGDATHIRGINILGRSTISFTTTAVDPDFPTRIAMPFYAAIPVGTRDTPATKPIPTAGPYYIAAYRPGHLLVLRQNPGYRGPRDGRTPSIVYRLGGPRSPPAWRLVATGKAEYDADPLAPTQLAAARRAGGQHIRLRVAPAPATYYLALNLRSPRMRDPRLRRAIALAIDRQALAATLGPDAATATDQYLPPSSLGYPGSGLAYTTGAEDVPAARHLLAAAGIHTPITLRLSSCNDAVCRANGAPARVRLLRSELGRIGIELAIDALPRPDQFALDTSHTARYDIADEGFVFPNPDPSLLEFPLTAEANLPLTSAMHTADRAPIPERYADWSRVELAIARRDAPIVAYAVGNTLTLTSSRLGCIMLQPEYGLDLTRACVATAQH